VNNNNNFEVYLAGKIDGLTLEEANQQRQEIAEKLNSFGIRCRNPLRGRSKIFNSSDTISSTSVKENNISIQEIIRRDLNDIDRCNVILVLTGDCPSFGTTGEFWYATWAAKKPTIVISKNNHNIVGNNWLTYYATKIVPDINSAIEVIKEWKLYWDNGNKVYDTR
jgi:nucleoside 2-deoxyribosyltransferase